MHHDKTVRSQLTEYPVGGELRVTSVRRMAGRWCSFISKQSTTRQMMRYIHGREQLDIAVVPNAGQEAAVLLDKNVMHIFSKHVLHVDMCFDD